MLRQAQIIGDQVGMLTQPIAGALDVDNDGVMKQTIEQRGCDHRIAENLAPFGKAAVGGQDHRAALIARIDQLEEQITGAGADAEVPNLINDQQRRAAEKKAMLLGEVVRDPKAEERILQQLIELKEAFTARRQAPHRRRMRMQ